jgi:hypothetical protein
MMSAALPCSGATRYRWPDGLPERARMQNTLTEKTKSPGGSAMVRRAGLCLPERGVSDKHRCCRGAAKKSADPGAQIPLRIARAGNSVRNELCAAQTSRRSKKLAHWQSIASLRAPPVPRRRSAQRTNRHPDRLSIGR